MTNVAVTNAAPGGWAARHPRLAGALLLLALHAAFAPFGATAFGLKSEVGIFLIGASQIVYLMPALILLMKLGRAEMAKGMLFGALATFVVNAGGCAVFLYELSKI